MSGHLILLGAALATSMLQGTQQENDNESSVVIDNQPSQVDLSDNFETNHENIVVTSDSDSGEVSVEVGVSSLANTTSSSSDNSNESNCTYAAVLHGEFGGLPGGESQSGDRTAEGPNSGTQIAETSGDGTIINLAWWKSCPGGVTNAFIWLPPAVNTQDLIDTAYARLTAQIPRPVPDISPAPEVGTVVNLGLWLAVDDPGLTWVRVDLAGVWGEVRARHAGFTIDFGNGDQVSCDGIGTPIVDPDTADEGPCGYTYRTLPPDGDAFTVTMTSTYEVTYNTSRGGSGSLGTLDRSTTFSYTVDEIQTIGIDG